MKIYPVTLTEAIIEDARAYSTFNDFFTRQLKPELRPIEKNSQIIVSPVDGTVAQIGRIQQNQLIQAKNFYFSLESLLGDDPKLASLFYDGEFATLYLAPHNYHRVHMPLTGSLKKTIYIPGKLFSVNQMTSEIIPHLYSRNERLVTLFETEAGPMAIILVGAMIVGSIKTVWIDQPIRSHRIHTREFTNEVTLEKGAELGLFKLGSTVILLYPHNTMTWSSNIQPGSSLQFGQPLGQLQK